MSFAVFHSKIERDAFNPEIIRAAVREAKAKGLIAESGMPVSIAKTGRPAAALGNVKTQWMDITPALAREWLKNNFGNRKISDDTVKAYARDMAAGVWTATHQGIAFNDRDELIDGQHRLLAIILSGVTVRMLVTFGLPAKIDGHEMTTMDAVDRHRPRSVSNQLRIQHGMKNGPAIAMIGASLAVLCQPERTRRLSVDQTLKIYAEFRSAVDWVIDVKSPEKGIRSKGVLAACAFAVTAVPPVKSLCRMIFHPDPETPAPMVAKLRDFLVSDAAVLLGRSSDRGLAELTLQALYQDHLQDPAPTLELDPAGIRFFASKQPARVAKITSFFTLPS
jgi:hypothetical protein